MSSKLLLAMFCCAGALIAWTARASDERQDSAQTPAQADVGSPHASMVSPGSGSEAESTPDHSAAGCRTLESLRKDEPAIWEHFRRLITKGLGQLDAEGDESPLSFAGSNTSVPGELVLVADTPRGLALVLLQPHEDGLYEDVAWVWLADSEATLAEVDPIVSSPGTGNGDRVVAVDCDPIDNNTWCCTFVRSDGKVRMMCICRRGNRWEVCFDTGWM